MRSGEKMIRGLVLLLLCTASALCAAQSAGEKRVALVIGNAAYKSSPLINPVNDARAIADQLKALGYDVISRENLKVAQIPGALREFRSRIQPGAVAMFFYAGHGVQIRGVNYLPLREHRRQRPEGS